MAIRTPRPSRLELCLPSSFLQHQCHCWARTCPGTVGGEHGRGQFAVREGWTSWAEVMAGPWSLCMRDLGCKEHPSATPTPHDHSHPASILALPSSSLSPVGMGLMSLQLPTLPLSQPPRRKELHGTHHGTNGPCQKP